MSATAPAAPGSESRSASSGAAWRRLGIYFKRHRPDFARGALTTIFYTAMTAIYPPMVGWAYRAVEQGLGNAEIVRRCWWIAGVTLLLGAFRYLSRVSIFNTARQIEYEIRGDLFAHLQRLSQRFFSDWRTGDLMSRAVNDLNSVRLMLGPGVLSVVQTPLMFVASFSMMFWIDAKLTLLVLIPYPIFLWVARHFGRTMHRANLGVQEGLSSLSNELQESISGISVVKAYAMEDAMTRRFARANHSLYRRQLRMIRVMAAFPTLAGLLPAVSLWVVFWFVGNRISTGQMQLSVFFTFAMYIYQLTFPTFIMGWAFALWQRGRASMERIEVILATEPRIASPEHGLAPETVHGEIEFCDVSFAYNRDREPVLRGINLRIPAGTSLGIVGPVGCGKTSLAALIPRLYDADRGRVLLDGHDVRDYELGVLRRSIASVPQDPFLFSMSLADNVAYGDPKADRDAIRDAALRAQLAKDIDDLPRGYDTLVGERGVMLSGGQRQRATLARALLCEAPVLILDDALSSVDAETESEILGALRGEFDTRTVIVISHRTASVRDADQIIVLDEGEIVERGRHSELLAKGGLYSRLAEEEELEEATRALGAAD